MTRQHMFDEDEDAEDEYLGATPTEVIESLQEQVADYMARVGWLRTNVAGMRKWIALHRAGELSAKAAFEQIEIDIERIAGPPPPEPQ